MINYSIGQQNFEKILFQVGAIITAELNNQLMQFYNTDCDGIDVYLERSTALDKTEMSIITVGSARGDYSNWHAGYVDGTYQYNIDVWTNSKSIGDEDGDKLSAVRRNRIVGIVRAILEDPIYKTLGFMPGSIGNLRVQSFEIGSVKKGELDADNTTIGRIVLQLKAEEVSELIVAPDLLSAITSITLGLTGQGFKFVYGADGPIPPNPNFVRIFDIETNETLALVPNSTTQNPSEYAVQVLRVLQQQLGYSGATIIQKLN